MSACRSSFPLFFLAALLCGCALTMPGKAESGGNIRVLVLKGANSITIKGASGNGELLIVKSYAKTVSLNGVIRELPLSFMPDKDHIYINNRPYVGKIEVMDGMAGLMAVNELPLETYLVGIINNEVSTKWPEDVVKTQAVIARTYALYQKKKKENGPYHLEGSVLGQVYSGVAAEDEAASQAVRATAGEVVYFNGEPALTVYHSNAGGMTDSSKEIWKMDYPYLRSVESPYDSEAPQFLWEYSITSLSLKEELRGSGYSIGEPGEIKVESFTVGGRVKAAVIKDFDGRAVRLSGENLRKVIGYSSLRSAAFTVEKVADAFVFRGRGSGHGVGLSQWGAKGMAENGYSYREIVRYYYPGTSLRKAY